MASHRANVNHESDFDPLPEDEGGLRAPPHLKGWRKAWWWFDFIILVKLARLRFIAVLVVIGAIITQWDLLAAYYDKWTRPASAAQVGGGDVEWFCPMHPSVVRDNPREKCPVCFMPLSKRKKGDLHEEALPAGVVNRVQLSPYRIVLAGVQTWKLDYVPLVKDITAVGFVEFDERGQRTVSARVKGRIDKLFVNQTGQMVAEDEVLASLYSPELNVTVQNLVDAQRNGSPELLRSARSRLQLLGISGDQIDEILATGKTNTHLKIRSPISGHVIKKYVREGQYVDEGTPLYDVADLSTVWIQAQVYEDEMGFLPLEQASDSSDDADGGVTVTATTRAFPNEPFQGKLAFIYPHVDEATRTVTVRVELPNPGHKLRPGTTATIKIHVPASSLKRLDAGASADAMRREMLSQGMVLAVPDSSIIDTGSQQIVYRQSSPGVFEGVKVELGPKMTGPDDVTFYPVLDGLKPGERVVTSGSFLVDAETRLNPAAGSIYFGGSGGSKSGQSSVTTVRPSTPEDPDAKITAELAKLSDAERREVESQKYCPILQSNKLGSMGPPVKVTIQGHNVFLCCDGCKNAATENPAAPKIGVAFMPALDEGTTLDMPITVPRASITHSADDLKARDALLRGFPEVESVIGKAGRADTPTDPAPLDMVETFVNFRPKELWPKRVLKFNDAARQVQVVLQALEAHGYIAKATHHEDRKSLLNEASQKALERFDETMRELASLRYQEFERDLGPILTRYAIEDVLARMRRAGDLNLPSGVDQRQETDKLAAKFTSEYGSWLAKNPAQEDVTQLVRQVADQLKDAGAIKDLVNALELKQSRRASVSGAIGEVMGARRKTFTGEVFNDLIAHRDELWRERVRHIDWELFDQGTEAFNTYAMEELVKGAKSATLLSGAAHAADSQRYAQAVLMSQLGQPFDQAVFRPFLGLRDHLNAPFQKSVFFWPRQTGPKGDLVDDEMGRVLQVPGWSNIFTQPIINRIEMLSTGVRTDIGVKVFGPDLETIDKVCKDIEAVLKPIHGARDVIAAPIMGKGYLQIDIDREKAARYGITVEDIQNEIEVALAGRAVTYTVEKRDRFPVRVRYVRADREDEESIRRLLVSPASAMGGSGAMASNPSMPASEPSSDAAHSATPEHAISGKTLIPLSAVANVQIVEGPAMIKSEDGRLLNYVTLNVRGRDIVGFVDEAQRVVSQRVKMPEAVHIEWSGEFEHQVRAARTLRFVFPAVIVLIFVILYLTYNDLADAVLMMTAVPEALAGGAFFMYFFPKIMQGWSAPPMDFSVAVWVGFIACFGMATETGIIMLVYLRAAIDKRGGLENMKSLEELRQAVIEGAVHRLRPKLLTEGVAILAVFPMVFAKGVGGEILAPMALPVLGGLLISDEVVDLFLPVRFYWVRRARWRKLQNEKKHEPAEIMSVRPLSP